MGAYIGAYKRFGSGDSDTNERRLEQARSYVPTLESAYREIAELKEKPAQENLYLEDEIRGEIGVEGIVGQSSGLRHVLSLVETVALSDSTVLLTGNTEVEPRRPRDFTLADHRDIWARSRVDGSSGCPPLGRIDEK